MMLRLPQLTPRPQRASSLSYKGAKPRYHPPALSVMGGLL